MSHNEVIAEIKKEDKKPKKIFYLVLIGSVVVGMISGFLASFVEDSTAINNWINAGMDMVNQTALFTYIFSVVGYAQIPNYYGDAAAIIQKFVLFAVGLILSMVVAMVASVKIVNFEKEMNPEKKGSAYDFNFQKKWLASSDETLKLSKNAKRIQE